jgi:hypothetical protein
VLQQETVQGIMDDARREFRHQDNCEWLSWAGSLMPELAKQVEEEKRAAEKKRAEDEARIREELRLATEERDQLRREERERRRVRLEAEEVLRLRELLRSKQIDGAEFKRQYEQVQATVSRQLRDSDEEMEVELEATGNREKRKAIAQLEEVEESGMPVLQKRVKQTPLVVSSDEGEDELSAAESEKIAEAIPEAVIVAKRG